MAAEAVATGDWCKTSQDYTKTHINNETNAQNQVNYSVLTYIYTQKNEKQSKSYVLAKTEQKSSLQTQAPVRNAT